MEELGGLLAVKDGKPVGMMGSAGPLHALARQAYERTKGDEETAGRKPDALISIIFSAAALEAFIMELQRGADIVRDASWSQSYLKALADVLDEAERSRGSVQLKYLVAKQVLSGESYDRGAQPFQDFDLLFQLRNAIVHMKPQDFALEPHRLVTQLAARRLCEVGGPLPIESWLSKIETRAVARWACNVMPAMALSLAAAVPNTDQTIKAFFGFWAVTFPVVE